MANVASATPKLKESVQAKTASSATAASARAVAQKKPASQAAAAATDAGERASALAFLGNLATEVSKGTVNLPCFPDVVMRIRKALAAPDVGLIEIVKIVGTEPRLAARFAKALRAVFLKRH